MCHKANGPLRDRGLLPALGVLHSHLPSHDNVFHEVRRGLYGRRRHRDTRGVAHDHPVRDKVGCSGRSGTGRLPHAITERPGCNGHIAPRRVGPPVRPCGPRADTGAHYFGLRHLRQSELIRQWDHKKLDVSNGPAERTVLARRWSELRGGGDEGLTANTEPIRSLSPPDT